MRKIINKKKSVSFGLKKFHREQKREKKRRQIKIEKQVRNSIKRKIDKVKGNHSQAEYFQLDAPEVFSLIENTEETIVYFNKAEKLFKKGEPVFFNQNRVQNLTPDALTVLTALITDKKIIQGVPFYGNEPKDHASIEMMRKAGFYQFVKPTRKFIRKLQKGVKSSLIHTVSNRKVIGELAAVVSKDAQLYSFGNKDKNQDIYTIIIEAMANTNNHASGDGKQEIYDWWLMAYKNPGSRVTSFCFLDLGVGIFESLKGQIDQGLYSNLKGFLGEGQRVEILRRIFGGESKSSTEQKERGKGLYEIYERVKGSDSILNFKLMSNDVFATINSNGAEIHKMNVNFDGTLLYWEYGKHV